MIARAVQIFFLLGLIASVCGETKPLETGEIYRLDFTDVDGNRISTAGGHVCIVIVTTREDQEKARALGDRVPEKYIGQAECRFVTIINFQKKIRSPFRPLTNVLVRRHLNQEARRIQPRYDKAHLARNPRNDLVAVPDFDGSAVAQLGIDPLSNEFAAFLFDGKGRLVRLWSGVPAPAELAAALAAAKPGG